MSIEPFKFYEGTSNALSPFSAHQIDMWGYLFPTVEHAYQSSRIIPGPERESIKSARSPLIAWQLGQKYKKDPKLVVPDFNKDTVMEELFRAKLNQHSDVREVLKSSGDREIQKVIDHDYYWGMGKDGSGQNKMGKLWMKLRSEI